MDQSPKVKLCLYYKPRKLSSCFSARPKLSRSRVLCSRAADLYTSFYAMRMAAQGCQVRKFVGYQIFFVWIPNLCGSRIQKYQKTLPWLLVNYSMSALFRLFHHQLPSYCFSQFETDILTRQTAFFTRFQIKIAQVKQRLRLKPK